MFRFLRTIFIADERLRRQIAIERQVSAALGKTLDKVHRRALHAERLNKRLTDAISTVFECYMQGEAAIPEHAMACLQDAFEEYFEGGKHGV